MDGLLAKKLAWLLRHGAESVGLKYTYGGYLYVDQVLQLPHFENDTLEDIVRIVESNEHRRFELSEETETGKLRICAYQGHSAKVEGLELTPITDSRLHPKVVHGTYLRHWESIRQKGLNRMSRNHIHFTIGEPGEEGIVSTMRPDCEIVIYIDLKNALDNGFKFYLSKNNIILTEGDQSGCLPSTYFKEVFQRFPRKCTLPVFEDILKW